MFKTDNTYHHFSDGVYAKETVIKAGESGTNKNLPPYLSVYFIIKT